MITYVLKPDCITFFVDGIIAFDCPLDRIKARPEDALKAMKMVEEVWVEKYKSLKGGDMQ